MPTNRLFHSAQVYLLQQLTHREQVSSISELSFRISIKRQDYIDTPSSHGNVLVVRLSAAPEHLIKPAFEGLDAENSYEPIQVAITERQPLVNFDRHSWQAYSAMPKGIRQRGDIRILIRRHALEHILHISTDGVRKYGNVGGFLAGKVYSDIQDESPFLDIVDFISPSQLQGNPLDWNFDQKAWQLVLAEARKKSSTDQLVGWYRTYYSEQWEPHLGIELMDRQVRKVVNTKLFSHADQLLHRTRFPDPWMVGLVVDLDGMIKFYQWKHGKVVPCQGYYIYDQQP